MRIKARIVRILGIFVALFAFSAGYALTSGKLPMSATAQARPLTMPANPHILFLAPAGAQRGLLNSDVAVARGATLAWNWGGARMAASRLPLDALLIDASLLNTMTTSDRGWLRTQIRDGVVLVGLGVDDDGFARALGLTTFRQPTEGNAPIGPNGYRFIQAWVLGHPDDIAALEATNWLERIASGDGSWGSAVIKHPFGTSYRAQRGELNTDHEVELLFQAIRSITEYTYQERAKFNEQGG